MASHSPPASPPVSPLVLASASPRRAELLRRAGFEFTVCPVDCEETWLPGETPLAYVERVAAAKAVAACSLDAVIDTDPTPVILTADTTVWLDADGEPFAKPRDGAHATAMLRALTQGRPHRVTTACAFMRPPARPGASPQRLAQLSETTVVHMRALSDQQFASWIGPYLELARWRDKAGGYAIQGRAAALVESIEGSYTNVVGLPLAQVVAQLEVLHA
ncbi:Maf family protein [Enhygromyxa salina]|uniref:dTTP/UTP pyrophosphatase n=1 Tax=Enhygromyxa salina TaxID=215803 RepID=A0A2S9YPH0_9BACT|nr:nucleoside triphosphate pyrophosphatase [Enhygromyxa salina]PRQ06984.1 Maf-like protein YhdE [Enhygromyxa salina]